MAAMDAGTPSTKQRVCVVGAGPSGTAQLRAFASAKSKGVEIPEVVCYEKASEVGGLWNYTWRTGLDANGEPCHGSMYRYLWSNGPKEALEFADYGFEEHFGKAIPSYPPREVLFDYIKGRIDKSGVREWIQFDTTVRRVTYDEATTQFTVVSTCGGVESVEVFDFVVVCSGHFSTPNVPEWPGFPKFEGRILHAHDFRDALEFKDKDVLIVGTSYSAEDVGSQCYKYGAKTVTNCWRTAPMGWHFPDKFSTKPLLTHVEGSNVFFKDGTSQHIDAIILCTGYKHHFPFMAESLDLKTANRLWPDMLHKGIFMQTNPKCMYIGMQDQWFTFNMFDAQAWYARDYILGKIAMPSAADQEAEFNTWREREGTLEGDEENIRFQADYLQDLINDTDYPMFDIEQVVQLFLEWEHNKHGDIMGFRNYPHRSALTGTMAPVHHTPWLEALDDSMECYLADKPIEDTAEIASVKRSLSHL